MPLLKAHQSIRSAVAASKAIFFCPAGPFTETTVVHIVSDDHELINRVHYCPEKASSETDSTGGSSGMRLFTAIEKRLVRILNSKKSNQVPAKEVELLDKTEEPESWLQFTKCDTIPENLFPVNPVRSTQEEVVLYHKKDYKQLYRAVVEAGSSGAFIVCVDDSKDIPELARMFADFSSVDIITRATCVSDDFSFVLLSSILKRALRDVGFME